MTEFCRVYTNMCGMVLSKPVWLFAVPKVLIA